LSRASTASGRRRRRTRRAFIAVGITRVDPLYGTVRDAAVVVSLGNWILPISSPIKARQDP
jgi:hypothetical protein